MIEIVTEQLIIRNFKPGDWNDLFEIGLNYEESEFANMTMDRGQILRTSTKE
ncbi:hypothetical protein LCGC14_1210670 [marine sediment metagenome]|uniref:Uncharacterized protein n=1 Tax=marine sediment metagenome TaxID=412755 RepID=A0A0F9LE15_9ZZZZ